MVLDPQALRCQRCSEGLHRITLIEHAQGARRPGQEWAHDPPATPFWSLTGIKPVGEMSAWRCPRCYEVRLFALTAEQMEVLAASDHVERQRVGGGVSLSGEDREGQLSTEEPPDQD